MVILSVCLEREEEGGAGQDSEVVQNCVSVATAFQKKWAAFQKIAFSSFEKRSAQP